MSLSDDISQNRINPERINSLNELEALLLAGSVLDQVQERLAEHLTEVHPNNPERCPYYPTLQALRRSEEFLAELYGGLRVHTPADTMLHPGPFNRN